jgi:hypothetical protein
LVRELSDTLSDISGLGLRFDEHQSRGIEGFDRQQIPLPTTFRPVPGSV